MNSKWYNYKYEAIKLAENESDWILYFKSISKHYIKAFQINLEKLTWWGQKIKENNSSIDKFAIAHKIATYYQMFLALSPQKNGDLNIDKSLLNKFHKINDHNQIEKNNAIVSLLDLKKYEVLGDFFTLEEIMNIAVSFFKDPSLRREFFEKIISESGQNINKMTLKDMIPNKINNFQRTIF